MKTIGGLLNQQIKNRSFMCSHINCIAVSVADFLNDLFGLQIVLLIPCNSKGQFFDQSFQVQKKSGTKDLLHE